MAKSYYETQVAKSRKAIADAVAGKGVQTAIRQLQEKARIKDSLADLPARGALQSKRVIGRRSAAGGGAGIASPLKEVPGLRTYYDEKTIDSSCGNFELVYNPLLSITMLDANGNRVVFFYDSPT